jgi:Zn-finger nucleic acid-binding protein
MKAELEKEFKIIECCNCGVLFAVSEELNKNLLRTKNTFYCPNGHPQSYTKSTEERLKEEYDAIIKRKNDYLDEKLTKMVSLKKEVLKLKKGNKTKKK